jgi:hypothetical protein
MRPRVITAVALALCAGACAKATGSGQVSSPVGRSVWKGEDEEFVSIIRKKQDDNLLRLAQEHSAKKAQEERLSSERERRREAVPPSMYRTTEPPLPEPDLSLPITEIPRPPNGAASPTPSPSPPPPTQ